MRVTLNFKIINIDNLSYGSNLNNLKDVEKIKYEFNKRRFKRFQFSLKNN